MASKGWLQGKRVMAKVLEGGGQNRDAKPGNCVQAKKVE